MDWDQHVVTCADSLWAAFDSSDAVLRKGHLIWRQRQIEHIVAAWRFGRSDKVLALYTRAPLPRVVPYTRSDPNANDGSDATLVESRPLT